MTSETKDFIIHLFQKRCNGHFPQSSEEMLQADEFVLEARFILNELCEAVNLYEDE